MGTYLDLRLAHVQRYLYRSRSLPYQRGASTLVIRALGEPLDAFLTSWNATPAALPVVRCDGESRVSGRASLQLPDGVEDAALAPFTRALFDHVHQTVPAADLEAVVGTGASLLEARFGDMLDRAGRGEAFIAPGAHPDVPLLPLCGECGTYPADGARHRFPADALRRSGTAPAGDARVCQDCTAREEAAGFRAGAGHARRPEVEGRLFTDVSQRVAAGHELRPAPDDFSTFARLAPATDLRANHLATVSADVNSLGQLCAAVGAAGDAEALPDVARAVSTALWQGLVQGTVAVQGRLAEQPMRAGEDGDPGTATTRPLGVVAHWCGGDDLLATVPAPYAWTFVRHLLRGFVDAIGAAGLRLPSAARAWSPSLSVGLVFAHAKLPCTTCVHAAEAALDQAKNVSAQRRHRAGAALAAATDTDGATWSTVTWTDLTQASTYQPSDIDTFALPDLEETTLLEDLSALPQDTRRRTAAHMVEHGPTGLADFLIRLGHGELAGRLEAENPVVLRRGLAVVNRWWRP